MFSGTLVLFAAFWLAGSQEFGPEHRVVLYGSGYNIPGIVVLEIQETLSLIFRDTGLRVRLSFAKPGSKPAPNCTAVCVRFADDDPSTLAGHFSCPSPKAIACSRPFDHQRPAIVVMYARLESRVEDRRLRSRILGHALAHEVVHLLTRSEFHSETGLMKESWTYADYADMGRSTFRLLPADLEAIRSSLGPAVTSD